MNQILKKAIPTIHSILTIHNMIYELSFIPSHIKTQENDWLALKKMFPGIENYSQNKSSIMSEFRNAFEDYISNYSAELISMSLNRGAFIYHLCSFLKPKSILDLGSGFSTFIFAKHAEVNKLNNITSVDDSQFWLEETKKFLLNHNLTPPKLVTWDQFQVEPKQIFELTFLDIGTIEFRLQILPDLIKMVHEGGKLIVDDVHVPWYRKEIKKICKKENLNYLSLRKYTRTRLSHNAMIYA